MTLLVKNMEGKKVGQGILQIAQAAGEAKKTNPDTINATIGMYCDDLGNLYEFDTINEILDELTYEEKFAYANSTGGALANQAFINWVFEDKINFEAMKLNVAAIATPGATGALGLCVKNLIEEQQSIIFSEISWDAYKIMCIDKNINAQTFNSFKNDLFDIESFNETVDQVANKQDKVLVIINDPCNNPTGYSLTSTEWDAIYDKLEKVSQEKEVVLVYDIAYLDFGNKEQFFHNINRYEYLNDKFTTMVAFSGSKTFALYGGRLGSCICLSKNKNYTEDFMNAFEFSTRSGWSNVAKTGLSVIEKLTVDAEKMSHFKADLNKAQKVLSNRIDIFKREADKENIKHLPLVDGFFAFIPTENSRAVYELCIQEDLFIIPMENGLRIALCSVNEKQIVKMIEILAKNLKIAV